MTESLMAPELLASLLDLAFAAMIVRDPESRVVFWNQRSEEVYGWSRDEALGRVTHELLQTTFPESEAAVDQALQITGRWEGELVHTRQDGRNITVLSRQALQRDEAGKPVSILEVNVDISDRLQVEQELRAANIRLSQLAGLIDLAHDAIILRDLNARIRIWNHGAEERYGWTAAEAVGKRSHDLLRTEFPVPLDEVYAELLQTDRWEGELVHTRRDGQRVIVASRWALRRDAAGRPLEVMEINNDITARRQAEEQVRKLNAELEQRVEERTAQLAATNKELEAFSYSVSHDLRAPLRAIDGFSRILVEDFGAELSVDANEYLDLIRQSTQQMGRLIDDLLAFSRLGRQALQRRTVDMSELARSALALLEPDCQGREVRADVAELPPAEADAILLRQVFVNLLSNALKFTRSRPVAEIEVGWQPGDDGATVYYVRDNGVGFDMQYVGKLFGVFQRLHLADEYEGNGVGLALAQRIIHRHGGRIWAESRADHGATFFFTLNEAKHA